MLRRHSPLSVAQTERYIYKTYFVRLYIHIYIYRHIFPLTKLANVSESMEANVAILFSDLGLCLRLQAAAPPQSQGQAKVEKLTIINIFTTDNIVLHIR